MSDQIIDLQQMTATDSMADPGPPGGCCTPHPFGSTFLTCFGCTFTS